MTRLTSIRLYSLRGDTVVRLASMRSAAELLGRRTEPEAQAAHARVATLVAEAEPLVTELCALSDRLPLDAEHAQVHPGYEIRRPQPVKRHRFGAKAPSSSPRFEPDPADAADFQRLKDLYLAVERLFKEAITAARFGDERWAVDSSAVESARKEYHAWAARRVAELEPAQTPKRRLAFLGR